MKKKRLNQRGDIASLAIGAVGTIFSGIQTLNANSQASQTKAEDTQLLNEAQQAQQQQSADTGLIATRQAQESALNPVNSKFSGNGTILTGPLGIPAPAQASPSALLGT